MLSWLAGVALAAAPDVRVETLDNGLTVILEPRPTMGVIGMDLRFPVGAEREGPGELGLTHLVEHRMFGGSRHVPPGVDWLDVAGIRWNAATGMDTTEVWMRFHPSALERALFLVSDHVGWLGEASEGTSDEVMTAAVAADVAGVLQELKQRFPTPESRAPSTALALAVPPDHPQAHDVAGDPAHIAATTPAQLRAYWRQHYGPDNATLTLVGALDPDETLARVRHWFSDVPARSPAAPPPLPGLMDGVTDGVTGGVTGGRDAAMSAGVEGWLAIWPTPSQRHPDAMALALLADVLNQTAPAGTLIAWNGRERTGIFLYGVSGTAAEAEVQVEAALAGSRGGEAVGLEAARTAAIASLEEALSKPETRAAWLGRCHQRFGDVACVSEALERLKAVTAEDLQALVADHFVEERRSTLTISPSVEDALPAPQLTLPALSRLAIEDLPPSDGGPDRSGPPPLGVATPRALPAPELVTLAGGAPLFHVRVPDAREVSVSVALHVESGVTADAAANRAWAALMGDSRLGVTVAPGEARLQLQTTPDALEEGMAAMSRALSRLWLSASALGETVRELASTPPSPMTLLRQSWFTGPLRPPSAEAWSALTRRQVQRLHRALRRAPLTVVTAGDLSADDAAALVSAHLPRRSAGTPTNTPLFTPTGSETLGVPSPGAPRATLMLALPYPTPGHPDTWGASVLAHALEGAAQGRLRSVRGLVYGLRIDVTQGPSHGLMILRTETAPEAVGEVIQEVEALLTRIARHGLPPVLIDSARRDLIREWDRSLSSPQAAARRYAVYHRGRSLEDDRGGLEALADLSRPESQALAMRYLGDSAARRWIVTGDPAQIPHLPVRWLMH